MSYWRRDKTALKLMRLQLSKRPLGFVIRIPGQIARKGSRKANSVAENVRKQIADRAMHYQWRHAPRAKVEVKFSFHAGNQQIPDLQNLVKFYLDLLFPTLFLDDRQVNLLTAQSSRRMTSYQLSSFPDPYVFIQVQRLAEYKRRLKLYQLLTYTSDFQEYLKYSSKYEHLSEDVEHDVSRSLLYLAEYKNVMQEAHLKLSSISYFDQPHVDSSSYLSQMLNIEPLTINLGSLPRIGESHEYKQRIRERLQQFAQNETIFKQIVVPVELDVQVASRSLLLSKDLDNIMRDICPLVMQELLHDNAYLYGYRVYVTERGVAPEAENIRIKILPQGATSSFECVIDQTFEAAREWIGRQLH